MANKAAPKMTKKEIEEAKKRRLMVIILAIFMVGIMLLGVLLQFFSPSSIRVTDNGDAGTTNAFNSIVDALKYLPSNANYVRYVDLNASSAIAEWSRSNPYVGANLPNASIMGTTAKKDALASFPYPTLSLLVIEDQQQAIVLSDFGGKYDNEKYSKVSIKGVDLRMVTDLYGFTADSYPTISGRKEYVTEVANFIKGSTSANTAYADYAGLIAHANQSASTAQFAVVGTSVSLGLGDRYFAGVTPINDTMCDYKIVLHLNQTFNETRQKELSDSWQGGAAVYGIQSQPLEFIDDYLIMSARGSIKTCLDDMAETTRWNFILG
jgi:hypothetical protein